GDERGEGRIGRLAQLLDALEVVRVRVPAVEFDLDERDTGLDKPPRQEAALTKWCSTIAVADFRFFLPNIKGLESWAEHHLRSAAIQTLMLLDACLAARIGKVLL